MNGSGLREERDGADPPAAGQPPTRAAVLAAAREAFAARGYLGATIRQIAAAAGVDPALVHHYFGTEDRLLVTALASAVDPRRLLSQVVDGPAETLGERLVIRFLALREGDAGASASALLRTRRPRSVSGGRCANASFPSWSMSWWTG